MARPQKRDDFDALFTKGLKDPPAAGAPVAPIGPARAGKSSDPAYKKFTVVLKKQTQKTARRLADDMEPRRDFSEVVEELLQQWIENHKAKAS